MSAVPYAELRELAQAQIRRECRRFDFNWDSFLSYAPEWGITEVVHRRAVHQGRERGLDLRPTDIPTDTVLVAVQAVIAEWVAQPELRPSYDGFCEAQARRGDLGRQTQQVLAAGREAKVMGLVASGVCNNAEIGRRLGLDRTTVWRIRRRAETANAEPALLRPFPLPEIPPSERWPAMQFMTQTGMRLSADEVRWLVGIGQCYEAEGRVDDLMHAIRASAGPDVHDPWAYLQRCVFNRGDAWMVPAQLLADVLAWAGEKSMEYALIAIGGGYVRRPLTYLREVLADAVAIGKRPSGWPERPVAMAVGMARRWAHSLAVVDADEAVDAEAAAKRSGHFELYRRRYGREPWESGTDLQLLDGSDCCIGVKGLWGDDVNTLDLRERIIESSPGVKADATHLAAVDLDRQPVEDLSTCWPEKSEQAVKAGNLPDSDEIGRRQSDGEALKRTETDYRTLPRENWQPVLEHGSCRHPVAALLVSAMDLEAVAQVECAVGCGHRLYSDRGPFECPCHWPTAKAGQVARALPFLQRIRAGDTERASKSLEVELFT